MSTPRQLLVLTLMLVALAFLYPGVTQPVLTLTGHIEKSELAELGIELVAGPDLDSQTAQMLNMLSSFLGLDRIEGQMEAYRTTRSIWGTAEELAANGNALVAGLIVLFSIIIPVSKLLLQGISVWLPEARHRRPLLTLNGWLSKWSMADVYVMAMLVAYMAGAASGHMGDLLIMNASLEPGFYFFLAYCLFSIAVSGLISTAGEEPANA